MPEFFDDFLREFKRRRGSRKQDAYNPMLTIANKIRATKQQADQFKNLNIELVITPFGTGGAFVSEELVAAGKVTRRGRRPGTKGSTFTIQDYINGLLALDNIFKSGRINTIIQRRYDNTVRKVLKRKINRLKSLARGGTSGSLLLGESNEEGMGDKATGTSKKFTRRSADELGELWRGILREIDVPLTAAGGATNLTTETVFKSFSLSNIFKVNISSTHSRYTSVYMMVEFGTGEKAQPGPRRYKSLNATPFKVSPAMATAFGGDTSWWFSSLISVAYANLAVKRLRNAQRSHKRYEKFKTNPLAFTTGRGDALSPAKFIFDSRGLVADLREAYYDFYRKVIADINELILEECPFWPKGALELTKTKGPVAIIQAYDGLFNKIKVAKQ